MNFIWQCIIMGLLIIVIILAIFGAEAIVSRVCENELADQSYMKLHEGQTEGDCEDEARLPVYAAIAAFIVLIVPLQVTWIRVFKFYCDELKAEDQPYEQVPVEEPKTK